MKTFVFGFLTAAALGFGGWFLAWHYTTPTWRSLLEPRIATPELCPKAGSQLDCIMARWQVVKRQAKREEYQLDYETALALCKLGGCSAENLEDGPWAMACKKIFRSDWTTTQSLFDPCTCPRGAILIDQSLDRTEYHPWGDRLERALRSLDSDRYLKKCDTSEDPVDPDRIVADDYL